MPPPEPGGPRTRRPPRRDRRRGCCGPRCSRTRRRNRSRAGVAARIAARIGAAFHQRRRGLRRCGLVVSDGTRSLAPVDEIVAATGFRPDLGVLSELRIVLDHGTQAPVALAPLIDPNRHSCGGVRPHGAEELKHPDAGVYIVGMKSYGRAPRRARTAGDRRVHHALRRRRRRGCHRIALLRNDVRFRLQHVRRKRLRFRIRRSTGEGQDHCRRQGGLLRRSRAG